MNSLANNSLLPELSQDYDFDKQLKDGTKHECDLDIFFEKWFTIVKVNIAMQRRGIDRKFIGRKTGHCYTIQYKADSTAARTGNAFIETISVDTDNVPGWAYTTQAQYIFYYIPPAKEIRVVCVKQLKAALSQWKREHRLSPPVPNKGRYGKQYNTFGLLVPLKDFDEVCKGQLKMNEERS